MDDEPVIVINSVEDDDWMKALPGYKAEVKISGRKPRVRLKHIPGRHDQRTHGLRGTAAGGVKPKTDAGAAPAGAGSPAPAPMEFDRAKWEGMDAGTRRDEWKATSQGERDRMADAGNSIKKAQADRLEFAGRRPHTGDVKEDIRQRMDQIGDFVHPESAKMITSTVNELNDALAGSGVPDYLRHRLAMEAVDTLAAQDNEAMGRTLGDHGIHHIKGNIDASMAILDAHPGADSAEQKSAVYLAQVFHDTGYLTEPSHVFLDEGHPRWSMEHYDKNIRPLVDRALGERAGGDISHLIRTHDSTDVDWDGDPAGTAVRIADNVALFQKEKMPGVFRYVDGNTAVLGQLAEKKITIEQAKQQMTDNIDKANVSPKMKEQFHRAVEELNPSSPKFTIGMLGGMIDGFSWTGGHLQIRLRRDASMDVLQKFLDLGQRQFAKFAEAYGIPKEMLTKGLSFKFRGKTRTGSSKLRGPVVMETVVLEPVVKERLKNVPGQHNQETHGNRGVAAEGDKKTLIINPKIFKPGRAIGDGSYWVMADNSVYEVNDHYESCRMFLHDNDIPFVERSGDVEKGLLREFPAMTQLGGAIRISMHGDQAGIDFGYLDTKTFRRLQNLYLDGKFYADKMTIMGQVPSGDYGVLEMTKQDLQEGTGIIVRQEQKPWGAIKYNYEVRKELHPYATVIVLGADATTELRERIRRTLINPTEEQIDERIRHADRFF